MGCRDKGSGGQGVRWDVGIKGAEVEESGGV